MIKNNEYKIGSIIEMRKPHPSKTKTWRVVKIGITIKLQSVEFKEVYILIPRIKFVRQVKRIIQE